MFNANASMDTSICLLPPPQKQGKNLHISVKCQFLAFALCLERTAPELIHLVPFHNICCDPVKVIIITQIRPKNLTKKCA